MGVSPHSLQPMSCSSMVATYAAAMLAKIHSAINYQRVRALSHQRYQYHPGLRCEFRGQSGHLCNLMSAPSSIVQARQAGGHDHQYTPQSTPKQAFLFMVHQECLQVHSSHSLIPIPGLPRCCSIGATELICAWIICDTGASCSNNKWAGGAYTIKHL